MKLAVVYYNPKSPTVSNVIKHNIQYEIIKVDTLKKFKHEITKTHLKS